MADRPDDVAALRVEVAALRRRVTALEDGRPPPPSAVLPSPAMAGRTEPFATEAADDATAAAAPDWESRVGAKWVALAGGALLVLGVIFLLKLAFDRGWIGPLARIWLGIVGGGLLWVGGDVLRRRYDVYGEIVATTGGTMAVVTVLIAGTVAKYQAVTGWTPGGVLVAGGVVVAAMLAYAGLVRATVPLATALPLTVVLVSLGGLTVAGVAPIVGATLLVGVVAVSAWRRVEWGGAATQVAFLICTTIVVLNEPSTAWRLVLIVPVMTTTIGASLLRRVPATWTHGATVPAWLIGGFALAFTLDDWAPDAVTADGWTWLVVGLAAVAGALLAGRGYRAGHAGAALLFLTLWPLPVVDEPWALGVWGLQLAALAVVAWVRPSDGMTVGVTAAGGIVGWALLYFGFQASAPGPALAVGAAATIGAGIGWWALRRSRKVAAGFVADYFALGVLLLAPMATVAAMRSDPFVSLLWAIEAAVALAAGAWAGIRSLRLGGLIVIALMLARVVTIDLAGADAVIRVLAFIAVGGLLLAIGFVYARFLRHAGEPAPSSASATLRQEPPTPPEP